MIEGFEVDIRPSRGMTVIRCAGELDVATSGRFAEAIDLCMTRKPRAVLVDVSGLAFLGSEGMRLLLDLAERCKRERTRLDVMVNERERRLLEMAKIYELFPWRLTSLAAKAAGPRAMILTSEEAPAVESPSGG